MPPPPHRSRDRLIVSALWLSAASVAWGLLSGGVSVTVGVIEGSLGVLGLGLNVLADVTGSVVLLWRFQGTSFGTRREERTPRHARAS